jgi:DNA-binding winged helix-turn-helix (wHTH) protein/predicted ATPase
MDEPVETPRIRFGAYSVDLAARQLFRGKEALPLRQKTFAVLQYLLLRPRQLVSKAALLNGLWSDTHVRESVLTSCIHEIRDVLGDARRQPRFIETSHGSGYRFIGSIKQDRRRQAPNETVREPGSTSKESIVAFAAPVVGRDAELAQLEHWLASAQAGERQVIFITGEAGIGKTTLVDTLLRRAAEVTAKKGHVRRAAPAAVWIARGQCIEQYGTDEPFMPLLDALGRLCTRRGAEHVARSLRQHGLTWLLPPSGADPSETPMHEGADISPERMLQQLVEACEALAADRPLVLVLEDLHWSDPSTLDFILRLAQRLEPAQLVVLGTYRPADAHARNHRLRSVVAELQLHGHCMELPVDLLDAAAVDAYLRARFPDRRLPAGLSKWVHRRTEGNPLFMVNLADYLLVQGGLASPPLELQANLTQVGVPENLRRMIELQIDRLPPEDQQVLEVASVAGVEFSAAALAAGSAAELRAVERRCAALADRGQFIRALATADWPDGTIAARYAFVHALYQELLYQRIPPVRRTQLHQQIGRRMESAYGTRAVEIAAELAMHFERSHDHLRAVEYLQHAAATAVRRAAHREAITALTTALELLATVPHNRERTACELALHMALGSSLVAIHGNADSRVEATFARAQTLGSQLGNAPQILPAIWGLWAHNIVHARYTTALELAQQGLRLATQRNTHFAVGQAHRALMVTYLFLGHLIRAAHHETYGLTSIDAETYATRVATYGPDTGGAHGALLSWLLGYPDAAERKALAAVDCSRRLSPPFSLASALCFGGMIYSFRGDVAAAQRFAARATRFAGKYGIVPWSAPASIVSGWALTERGAVFEGITKMRSGLEGWRATGASTTQSLHYTVLAEALMKAGQIQAARTALDEALAMIERTGERWFEAEVQRLYGELLLQPARRSIPEAQFKAAEAQFRRALAIARRQRAKSLELRAAMSLSRLWRQQGTTTPARQLLSKTYAWFTEGFATKDLIDAKALLEELTV